MVIDPSPAENPCFPVFKGFPGCGLNPGYASGNWFTITSMLQDLDSLSARIGQLVQFVQRMQSDRLSLQARITSLEQERNALRDQLVREQSAQQEAVEQARNHASQVEALRKQSDAAEEQLRAEASRYRSDCETAQQGLQASQQQSERLRTAALAAQQRIDAVLMRLPGAPQE